MAPRPLLYLLDDRPAERWLIVDRDGTLTHDAGYTHRVDDLEVLPGVVPALTRLARADWGILVATNQAGIARGLFTVADMEAFHEALTTRLAAEGVPIRGIAACPHLPGAPRAEWDAICECRKPRPGLLTCLAAQHGFALTDALFAGNSPSDAGAANEAGVRFAWARDENEWTQVADALEGAL